MLIKKQAILFTLTLTALSLSSIMLRAMRPGARPTGPAVAAAPAGTTATTLPTLANVVTGNAAVTKIANDNAGQAQAQAQVKVAALQAQQQLLQAQQAAPKPTAPVATQSVDVYSASEATIGQMLARIRQNSALSFFCDQNGNPLSDEMRKYIEARSNVTVPLKQGRALNPIPADDLKFLKCFSVADLVQKSDNAQLPASGAGVIDIYLNNPAVVMLKTSTQSAYTGATQAKAASGKITAPKIAPKTPSIVATQTAPSAPVGKVMTASQMAAGKAVTVAPSPGTGRR